MKLKLGPIPDDKPVRVTITLSAELAALLRSYADAVGSRSSKPLTVERIVPPMLERFIKTDRAFMRTHPTCRGQHGAFGPVGSGRAELRLREVLNAKFPNDIEKPPNQSRWRIDVMLQSDHRVARVLKQRSHYRGEACYPCRRTWGECDSGTGAR